jgi:hypothetical protein
MSAKIKETLSDGFFRRQGNIAEIDINWNANSGDTLAMVIGSGTWTINGTKVQYFGYGLTMPNDKDWNFHLYQEGANSKDDVARSLLHSMEFDNGVRVFTNNSAALRMKSIQNVDVRHMSGDYPIMKAGKKQVLLFLKAEHLKNKKAKPKKPKRKREGVSAPVDKKKKVRRCRANELPQQEERVSIT